MSTHHANVLVHLDHALEIDELAALQGALSHIEGVTQVRPGARPRLVTVDYDPDATAAKTIIEQVRRQGLSAQLIGM